MNNLGKFLLKGVLITGIFISPYIPSFGQDKENVREIDKWFLKTSYSVIKPGNDEIQNHFHNLEGINVGIGRKFFPKINGKIEFNTKLYSERGFESPAATKVNIYSVGATFGGGIKIKNWEISTGGGIQYKKAEAYAKVNGKKVFEKKEEGPVFTGKADIGYHVLKGIKVFFGINYERGFGGTEEDNTDAEAKGWEIGFIFHPSEIFKP